MDQSVEELQASGHYFRVKFGPHPLSMWAEQEPGNALVLPANGPAQPANAPVQPANAPVQPANAPIPPASVPIAPQNQTGTTEDDTWIIMTLIFLICLFICLIPVPSLTNIFPFSESLYVPGSFYKELMLSRHNDVLALNVSEGDSYRVGNQLVYGEYIKSELEGMNSLLGKLVARTGDLEGDRLVSIVQNATESWAETQCILTRIDEFATQRLGSVSNLIDHTMKGVENLSLGISEDSGMRIFGLSRINLLVQMGLVKKDSNDNHSKRRAAWKETCKVQQIMSSTTAGLVEDYSASPRAFFKLGSSMSSIRLLPKTLQTWMEEHEIPYITEAHRNLTTKKPSTWFMAIGVLIEFLSEKRQEGDMKKSIKICEDIESVKAHYFAIMQFIRYFDVVEIAIEYRWQISGISRYTPCCTAGPFCDADYLITSDHWRYEENMAKDPVEYLRQLQLALGSFVGKMRQDGIRQLSEAFMEESESAETVQGNLML